MKESLAEVLDSVKVLYLKRFTEKDIDDLITFYSSELGQKSLNLSLETISLYNNYRINTLPKIQKRFIRAVNYLETRQSFKRADNYFIQKPIDAQSIEKSKILPVELFYNEEKWKSISPKEINANAELCIANKELQIYAFLVTEKTSLTLSNLRQALVFQLRRVTSELNIVNEELRNVNGKEILCIRLNATVNNYDLVYQWYIYTSDQGAVQYLVFTDKDTYEQNENEFDYILNGLVLNF
jgi:hypothetical protein